ncbi:MAG: hypothetical protein K2X87_14415, partial [Gemmataceae bacterium]|nr:hypothetical protein [Gemmataceae bacterium]
SGSSGEAGVLTARCTRTRFTRQTLVMLCGQDAGRFKSGDRCAVKVTSIDPSRRKVTVALAS